jgi:solute carrier family 25 (adenine nucleotide translocator) protein 4/5/6/31
MPRTWTSEIALASGGVALSVAAGALGAKLAGAVDGLKLSEFIARFVAGGISGAVAKTITAPLEAIKLKLQYAEDDDEGALDCARRIWEREGWRGFYRGNVANVLRYFPTQAFNFAFKDKIKGLFPKVDRKKHPWKAVFVNIVAGGISGAGSLLLVYPLDSVRTQLIICTNDDGSPKYASMGDFVRDVVQIPGDVRKLYEGYAVSVAGIIPFRAIYFIVNDTLRAILPWIRDEGTRASRVSCASSPPRRARRSAPRTPATPSTRCVGACRRTRNGPSASAATKGTWIASRRSIASKASGRSSAAPATTRSAPSPPRSHSSPTAS